LVGSGSCFEMMIQDNRSIDDGVTCSNSDTYLFHHGPKMIHYFSVGMAHGDSVPGTSIGGREGCPRTRHSPDFDTGHIDACEDPF
jgi:hypothetical protein